MKHSKLSALLGMMLGLSSTLYADAPAANNSWLIGQPYVAVQLGYGEMQTGNGDSLAIIASAPPQIDNTKGGFAYRIAGGYLFKINDKFKIGPEIGYLNYPETSYQLYLQGRPVIDMKYTGYTVDLLANAQYYFFDNFYAIARFGAGYVSQSVNIAYTFYRSVYNASSTQFLPEAGLGVGYTINPHADISISYNTLFGGATPADASSSDQLNKVASVYTVMAGFNYRF